MICLSLILDHEPENLLYMLISLSFPLDRAPFGLLERLSLHQEAIATALATTPLTRGSVVLATCNRFEVYADLDAEPDDWVPGSLLTSIAMAANLPETELDTVATTATGHAAVVHLCEVTSGLRSAVIGETEIAGQVRRAHDAAREQGTLTHQLEHLFRTATRTSREVGHRTNIRSSGKSLVRLGLRIAEARIPDWSSARVLLIGTGAYAGASVAALRARGATSIQVFSPSGRAADYAAQHDLMPVAGDQLGEALATADLVVACTRAEEPLLTPDLLGQVSEQGLLLIDLGLPRNIDPTVAEVPGVSLLDLETIAKHAPVAELSAEAEAHEIVRAAAAEFHALEAERDAVPSLRALRTHVAAILEEELCESDQVATALRRFTGKLLHEPMTRIRTLGREGRGDDAAQALATLFGIDVQQATAGDAFGSTPRAGQPPQSR